MWEHRTVSNKEYQTTGRVNPNETYVRLMDEVEETVKNFKAFVFAIRAGTVEKAPVGWSIKNEDQEELMCLGEILAKDISIDNLL